MIKGLTRICAKHVFVVGMLMLMFPLLVKADELNARSIMEKNFFVSKPKTIKTKSVMTLMSDKGSVRERKVDTVGKLQSNGNDTNVIIRFQYPPEFKGTGFLQIEDPGGDDGLWVYLPSLHKSRRLVANNRRDSFFGTDFSYGDITPPKIELYDHTLLRSEVVGGHECYVIQSIPKDDKEKRNSGYSKKITWVQKNNFLENKIEYYDTEGRQLKTQIVAQHKLIDPAGQRWFAMQREMINHRAGHKTMLVFSQVEVNRPIDDAFFSTRMLEREWSY